MNSTKCNVDITKLKGYYNSLDTSFNLEKIIIENFIDSKDPDYSGNTYDRFIKTVGDRYDKLIKEFGKESLLGLVCVRIEEHIVSEASRLVDMPYARVYEFIRWVDDDTIEVLVRE